jgi:hypothetical protein
LCLRGGGMCMDFTVSKSTHDQYYLAFIVMQNRFFNPWINSDNSLKVLLYDI